MAQQQKRERQSLSPQTNDLISPRESCIPQKNDFVNTLQSRKTLQNFTSQKSSLVSPQLSKKKQASFTSHKNDLVSPQQSKNKQQRFTSQEIDLVSPQHLRQKRQRCTTEQYKILLQRYLEHVDEQLEIVYLTKEEVNSIATELDITPKQVRCAMDNYRRRKINIAALRQELGIKTYCSPGPESQKRKEHVAKIVKSKMLNNSALKAPSQYKREGSTNSQQQNFRQLTQYQVQQTEDQVQFVEDQVQAEDPIRQADLELLHMKSVPGVEDSQLLYSKSVQLTKQCVLLAKEYVQLANDVALRYWGYPIDRAWPDNLENIDTEMASHEANDIDTKTESHNSEESTNKSSSKSEDMRSMVHLCMEFGKLFYDILKVEYSTFEGSIIETTTIDPVTTNKLCNITEISSSDTDDSCCNEDRCSKKESQNVCEVNPEIESRNHENSIFEFINVDSDDTCITEKCDVGNESH